ncbi:SPOR domain-containing protein [Sphingomonas sp. R1]|uniref:SPOR domain-containing protein n=1 Tax=Sphingomonas sp. R1 TaxID=399176 RepID=UPI00222583EA|nr:SPOR domain-containing protein [Sphingomonas sp. R1]UYY77698.1 SPOR domain-containing protein [Sphingomonas sp. R1]
MRISAALLFFALLGTSSLGLAQDAAVKAGVEAYNRQDFAAAMQHWRAAAAKGDPDAQYNLGQIYKLGRGVPVDLAAAEQWYRLAAAQGHELAEANYGMVLFENGKREAAVPWLERAVVHREPRAQYLLGVMLFNGDGVAKNWVRAYALMLRAAAGGLDAAARTLEQMDQYIPIADRQAGKALADRYATDERATAPAAGAPARAPALSADTSVAAAPPRAPRATRTAAGTPRAPAPVAATGPWRVQLGAFATPGNAEKLWGQVRPRFPGRQPFYPKSGTLTRLLVGPFATRAEAEKACGALAPCMAVQR